MEVTVSESGGRGAPPRGDRGGKPQGDQRDRRDQDGRGKSSGQRDYRDRWREDKSSGQRGRRDREDDKPQGPVAPELPEDVDVSALDIEVRKELRSLPKDLAELVGKHLVAAGELVDTDPEAALEHARFAKVKASRIPVVREAVGLAAYHAGQWAEALSELRAVRRMTRSNMHVAVMADAERALGRSERALDLAKETDVKSLPPEVAAELRIVAAGARRDLGQLEAAVVALQGDDLDPTKQLPWSARLFYAYADNLLAAGRKDEAATWFTRAAEADNEEETDAAERAAELG